MTLILDGRVCAKKIIAQVKSDVAKLDFIPGLATILVGDDSASKLYVDMKSRACVDAGFNSKKILLPANISEDDLIAEIEALNVDVFVHGILVQLPLPKHIDRDKIFKSIIREKDVDGFHPVNMGNLLFGNEDLVSATPKGVLMLLDYYGIDVSGREVVIVNHSTIVGKPLSLLFLNRDATITVCNHMTKDLAKHTKSAEILVSGTGIPNLISADMVSDGVVVVDVGIAKVKGITVGDVDFDKVFPKCRAITPVPGGVGPMTIAALLRNTLNAAKKM